MPLIILIAAGAVALWGTRHTTDIQDQVRLRVLSICTAVASGQDMTGKLNPADPFAEGQAVQQIRRICPTLSELSRLEIVVTAGDTTSAAKSNRSVTHVATIKVQGVAKLILNVQRTGDIHILGFQLPVNVSAP